ncbi:integrase [Salinibacillus kushneri]|uniref:Integrase n=1 Tax=Salinibacillus kushneri TaxID=237682 RepID=A0A1I0IHX9_9BACI|nr:tyrosine-type recombinase/integrase [Salinibacillus kushneri]SET95719.1 integrase [Salinibacillus kushneri]
MAKGYARPRKNGKWQLEVDLGTYVDLKTGKRKRNRKYRTVKAKSQRDADTQLARFVAEVTGEGYYEPEKMMFVDFVKKEWLPKHAEKHLSHTTLSTHLRYLDIRILPAFQSLRLDQIRPKHIIDFLDNLQEDGMRLDKVKDENGEMKVKKGKLSKSTIYYHYRILNGIFNFAVKLGLIKENPTKKIDKPKLDTKEVEVYDIEEAARLLECLESEDHVLHWQIIVKLAITTGMRRSELFGLEFKHIDYENRVIKVRQAVTFSKEKGLQVHEIKKGNGVARKRNIVFSQTLLEPIKRLERIRKKERLAANQLWEDGKHNFLVCDETGKPYNPTSMQRWWERFIKRHKLKYVNIHALRHTSATLLINEGIHAKIISARLGHSDIRTTMNIYGHALKQADEVAATKLDSALEKKNLPTN